MNMNFCRAALSVAALLSVGGALAQTVSITNGAPGAGHLTANVDAFGSYGNYSGGYVDRFEPNGSARMEPTFSSALMLFSGSNRAILSSMPNMIGTYPGATWSTAVTGAVSNSNAFTATSSFEVRSGGAALLAISLVQTVTPAVAGSATLTQRYAITNVSGGALSFSLLRQWDMDLLWDLDFESDWVGASAGGVFAHEPGNNDQRVELRSGAGGLAHSAYFASKQGHAPTGGGPTMGYGTDTLIWDNFGLPGTWANYVPGVGYSTLGEAGLRGDAMMGLNYDITLAGGATTTVVMDSIYGSAAPVPEPFTMALGAAALAAGALRRRRRA